MAYKPSSYKAGKRPLLANTQAALGRMVSNISVLAARTQMAAFLGKQYNGDRDVYAAVGYNKDPLFDDYLGHYMRGDIAQRVVNAFPEETWRRPPVVRDGGGEDGEFNTAVINLTSAQLVSLNIEEERPNLWADIAMADKLAGIGEYGALLIGVNDGAALSTPLKKAASGARGPNALLYLTPLHQKQAVIATVEHDFQSPRYGKPLTYTCSFATGLSSGQVVVRQETVHWTRVVHIAENAPGSGVYGMPRLQPVYNRVDDLLKVMAGAGEAAWRLVYKGVVVTANDDYAPPDDDSVEDEIFEFTNNFKRYMLLVGAKAQIEGGEVVDPGALVKTIISLISAATKIPQRILMGSERGELSSAQDETAFKESVESRQTLFAEPKILRPLINRLIYCGVLPMPQDGRYTVSWPSLFAPTPAEQADINLKRAQTIVTLSPMGAPDAFIEEDEARALAQLPSRDGSAMDAMLEKEAVEGE